MPTLTYVEGWEHQTVSSNSFTGGAGAGVSDVITAAAAVTINTTNARTGAACLQLSPSAQLAKFLKQPFGGFPAVSVVSLYMRFPTLPAASCNVFNMGTVAGAAFSGRLWWDLGSGKFYIAVGTTQTGGSAVGPVLSAATWYRVDMRLNVSANPALLDCQIDGGTNVQVSAAQAATTVDGWVFGNDQATYTYTCQYDDFVASSTSADYPIGPHKVLAVQPGSGPAGQGGPGANVIEDGTGADISDANPAWSKLDEEPPLDSAGADTVTQVAVGASNYAEVNFADTTETVIWGAVAHAALRSAGTTANNGTTRIVYSDATTSDIYAGDMSETAPHHRVLLLTASKIDTTAKFNGLVGRVGFSSNVASVPWWLAMTVQYAVPQVGGTPILVDGFEHQSVSLLSFGGGSEGLGAGLLGTPTFPAGRNGVCLQCASAGSAVRFQKRIADSPIAVISFYYRLASGGGTLGTIFFATTTGASGCGRIYISAANQLGLQVAGTGPVYEGPTMDTTWRRIDIRINISADPWVVNWAIDGTPMTTMSVAGEPVGSVRFLAFGSQDALTRTDQFDDLVVSATIGDYPLGAHDVLYGVPTGDGTHNLNAHITNDTSGTTNLFNVLDEIPATTTDYIHQTVAGSGDYAEVTFPDQPAGKTVWGVEGLAALFSSVTAANNGITRIVDASGTTLTDIYSGDMSETTLNYRRAIITPPAGGWDSGYAGVKARVGFSTDVIDVPRWAGLMLQYAVSPMGAPSVPTGLTATAVSSSQINLDWNDYAGATGYDIERDGVVIVSDHPVSSYNDTGRSPSTLYTYRVRAVL